MSQSRQFHFPIRIGGRYHKRPMLLDWNITGIEKLAIGIDVRTRHRRGRKSYVKRLADDYKIDGSLGRYVNFGARFYPENRWAR